MGVQRRRCMTRDEQIMCLAERCNLYKAGDPSAASDICLQDIYGSGVEHPSKIKNVVAVLSCGNFHSGWRAVTNQPQAIKIVRRDWLLEPRNAEFAEELCLMQRLFPSICAVRINVQFCFRSNRVSRHPHPFNVSRSISANFHLYAPNSLLYPSGKLGRELTIRIRGKSAAAVNRNALMHLSEKSHQGNVQQSRL